MPFASPKQRRFMHARHPAIADRWEAEAKASGTAPVQPSRGRSTMHGRLKRKRAR